MVSCQTVGTIWPSLVAFRLKITRCTARETEKTKASVTLVSMTRPILCGFYLFFTFASSPDIFPIRSGYMSRNESVKTEGKRSFTAFCKFHGRLVSLFERQILTITTCWYGEPDPLTHAQNKQASRSCCLCGVLNGTFLAETRRYELSTLAALRLTALGSTFIFNAQTWDSFTWLWARE